MSIDDWTKLTKSISALDFAESPAFKAMVNFETSYIAKAMRGFELSPYAKMTRDIPELPFSKAIRDMQTALVATTEWQRLMQSHIVALSSSNNYPFGNIVKMNLPDGTVLQLLSELNAVDFSQRLQKALKPFDNSGDPHAEPATVASARNSTEGVDAIMASASTVVVDTQTTGSAHFAPAIWLLQQPAHVQVILLALNLWVILPLMSAFWSNRVNAYFDHKTPEARTIIYNEIKENFGVDEARRLRCARVTLKIRTAGSSSAAIVDSVSKGTAVEILESAGSWSLIRYKDAKSAAFREGWAASGYLSLEIN